MPPGRRPARPARCRVPGRATTKIISAPPARTACSRLLSPCPSHVIDPRENRDHLLKVGNRKDFLDDGMQPHDRDPAVRRLLLSDPHQSPQPPPRAITHT